MKIELTKKEEIKKKKPSTRAHTTEAPMHEQPQHPRGVFSVTPTRSASNAWRPAQESSLASPSSVRPIRNGAQIVAKNAKKTSSRGFELGPPICLETATTTEIRRHP